MSEVDVAGIRAFMDTWIKNIKGYRPIEIPPSGAPHHSVTAALVLARGHLDPVEEILDQAMALRGLVRRREAALRDKVSDAWDAEYQRRKQAGRFHDSDFKSGREKEAEINLAIREARLAHREIRELLDGVNETLDRIWLRYNGLRSTRDDLLQRLRGFSFESNLDRS